MTRQSKQSREATLRNDEQIREVIALILEQEINDPRIEFVTVTGADVNKDRSVADIYVTADKERYEEVLQGLKSASGRIRTLAGKALNWRVTPQLRWFIDPSIDEGERIDSALLQG